jgi:hypothetical protein
LSGIGASPVYLGFNVGVESRSRSSLCHTGVGVDLFHEQRNIRKITKIRAPRRISTPRQRAGLALKFDSRFDEPVMHLPYALPATHFIYPRDEKSLLFGNKAG